MVCLFKLSKVVCSNIFKHSLFCYFNYTVGFCLLSSEMTVISQKLTLEGLGEGSM